MSVYNWSKGLLALGVMDVSWSAILSPPPEQPWTNTWHPLMCTSSCLCLPYRASAQMLRKRSGCPWPPASRQSAPTFRRNWGTVSSFQKYMGIPIQYYSKLPGSGFRDREQTRSPGSDLMGWLGLLEGYLPFGCYRFKSNIKAICGFYTCFALDFWISRS